LYSCSLDALKRNGIEGICADSPQFHYVTSRLLAITIDWSPAKRRQKDVDASWTKKHGKSYFGYKLSACADKRYKLIRKIKITTASEHDTRQMEDVLDPSNTSRDLYGDKGYLYRLFTPLSKNEIPELQAL
jgi:IS5 family transposase